MTAVFDALVIGSGATGGWAAKELCEAGMKVVMLEAGAHLNPERDFTEHTPVFKLKFRGLGSPTDPHRAGDEYNRHLFVDETENPYTTPKDKPFAWTRSRMVGGRSITWYRNVYRFSDLDFKAASLDGEGEDWPISYAELAPYYDKVEDFIGVSGSYENLSYLPDGKFLPPMALTQCELHLQETSQRMGRPLFIGRTATLTVPHRGRPACHYCGPCSRGCRAGSYFSSPVSTLPAAQATGNFTLITDAIVRNITMDNEALANGASYVDRNTREEKEIRARVVVLCASTLESTRILLNSATSRFSTGLGNSSGILGRYLQDHITGFVGQGVYPPLKRKRPSTILRPNTFYIPRFRNLKGPDKGTSFIRGYGYQGIGGQSLYEHAFRVPGFGKDFKNAIKFGQESVVGLIAFGEMVPRFENHVSLDPNKKDAWGIPVLNIECTWGPNDLAMLKDAREQGLALLTQGGVNMFSTSHDTPAPGSAVHEVGTARMGKNPKTSVLNGYNQMHDIPNLFVTDGSSFVTNPCQNPTLTMMALTARACEYIVRSAQNGTLKRKSATV